jgi:Family of unknown function (DUF6328)
MTEERERLALKDEARTCIEEARMVLPGIQALFGFQLVAVFNQRFAELSLEKQLVHLASLGFVTVAIGLVMMPAAYHRIAERGWASRHFIDVTSRLLSWAMGMLMIGLGIDIALIVLIVGNSGALSALVALLVLAFFGSLWFMLPIRHRNRHPATLTPDSTTSHGNTSAKG